MAPSRLYIFGMGRKMKNFVVLTLGTGLGSGIISDGKLLIGQHGMAGEIGHVNVNSSANARQCKFFFAMQLICIIHYNHLTSRNVAMIHFCAIITPMGTVTTLG